MENKEQQEQQQATEQAQQKQEQTEQTTQNPEQQQKKKEKKEKKKAQKPFTYDFKEEIANLDRSYLKQRLNEPKEYTVPEVLAKKPQTEYLVGGVLRIQAILNNPEKYFDKNTYVCGWVKGYRLQGGGSVLFLEINDGSSLKGLQVVIDKSVTNFDQAVQCSKDASVKLYGKLVQSQGKGQAVELQLNEESHKIQVLGLQQNKEYPLPFEKRDLLHTTKEIMREHSHLRTRTKLMGAVMRVRNSLSQATHLFFQSNNFQYVHTPLVTCSDCEGAGEMFQVTTLFADKGRQKSVKTVKVDDKGMIDYKEDFFKKPAYLTVSGQLAVENYCCSLGNVYTFGPTFRAETSNSTRHLAEFWMIEPELAFADLADDMDCAEQYVQFCINYVLNNNSEDIEFLTEYQQKEIEKKNKEDAKIDKSKKNNPLILPPLKDYLKSFIDAPFERITYTDAIKILQKAVAEGKVFEEDPNPTWENGLATEHEKFLCDYVFHKPVMVYNYPKEIKAFYMKLNDDQKTVACVDVLVPGVGELVGGSQREEKLDVLLQKMKDLGLDEKDYWWYLQLREYGSIPHSGFGLGFERLVMLTTGMSNIRDVIPYPRQTGYAEF